MQATSPTSTGIPRFYRPELDALRFLAFALVFIRHAVHPASRIGAALAAAGQSGVCLFFLLSAYLITELLEREHAKTGTVDLKAFYIRRILRIWPLYFSALLLARLIDWHAPHLQLSNGRLLASLLLAGNWYVFLYGLPASFALVLWSVSVEEQFYLLWPSVRKFLGRRSLLLTSLLTLPVSALAIILLSDGRHVDLQLWVDTFVELQFFGMGGLLALLLRGRAPHLHPGVRGLLFAAGLLLFAASEDLFHGPTVFPTPAHALAEYTSMLLGTLALFFALLGFSELGRARLLIYLGKISYGLYVFHILGLRLALRPAAWLNGHVALHPWAAETFLLTTGLLLTVLMAYLSYRFLETPFLRLKDRFTIIRSRSV